MHAIFSLLLNGFSGLDVPSSVSNFITTDASLSLSIDETKPGIFIV